MGWHFRRSYEVILDAQRKGAPCKWYDETKKIENIIRPGHYGIYKIIPGADPDCRGDRPTVPADLDRPELSAVR
jgi:hypothetical protein